MTALLLLSFWFLYRGIHFLRGYLRGKGAKFYYWKWYENWNEDTLGQKIDWYPHYRMWATGVKWTGIKDKPNAFERTALFYAIVHHLIFGTLFLGIILWGTIRIVW